jgi:Leu/Phe-tRNA-protein transferase
MRFCLAIELHIAKRYQEALNVYNIILSKNPSHKSARNNRACVYDDLGLLEDALDDLNKVIELYPYYVDAYNNRGYVSLKKRLYTQAVQDYQKSLSLKYPNYDAREMVTLFNHNQLDKIIIALGKLLSAGLGTTINSDEEKVLIRPLFSSRIILMVKDLHISKTYQRHLRQNAGRYKLIFDDTNYNAVIDRCLHHYNSADDAAFFELRRRIFANQKHMDKSPKYVAVCLYKDGRLVAGELGAIIGKYVYISFTGFHDEDFAGTVQLILLAQFLKEMRFTLIDFGHTTERWDKYKLQLGAKKISFETYIMLFRLLNPGSPKLIIKKNIAIQGTLTPSWIRTLRRSIRSGLFGAMARA